MSFAKHFECAACGRPNPQSGQLVDAIGALWRQRQDPDSGGLPRHPAPMCDGMVDSRRVLGPTSASAPPTGDVALTVPGTPARAGLGQVTVDAVGSKLDPIHI